MSAMTPTAGSSDPVEPIDVILTRVAGAVTRRARPTTSYEFVFQILRHGILSGELGPGTKLNQSQIAKALEVSTTPVREAMRDLATSGLLDIDAFKVSVVHTPTVAELEELYYLRQILETHAIRNVAASVTEEQLRAPAAIQAQMVAESDPATWLMLNAEFHKALAETCNSPKVVHFLDTLSGSLAFYLGLAIRSDPQRRIESDVEHLELLEACRTHDIERAVQITENHMDPARRLARIQMQHPD